MISPAIRTTHGFSHTHIVHLFPSNYDLVYKMPVLGARVHPSGSVSDRKLEHRIGKEKTMFGTKLEKQNTITIAVSNAMFSNDLVICLVVRSYSSIEVSEKHQPVLLWCGNNQGV